MLGTILAGLAVVTVVAPPAAASTRQLSIVQDDAAFLGISGHNPDAAIAEAKSLGADVVRTFVVWKSVSPQPESREMPAGFDPGNPDSPGYDWSVYDAFIDRARAAGLKVFLTLAPPLPYWASEQPEGCPHHVAGNRFLTLSCMWKPDPVLFGQFAHAVARRYGANAAGSHGGSVVLYSMWNEPNLEHYLFPQLERRGTRTVDVAAKRYRRLWFEGWKAISISDPARRKNVLFGETAAISSPIDTLYAALCMDERGRPFRGRMQRLQGCVRPRPLPIGGVAIHPYNDHASGTVFTRSFSPDSLSAAYVPRVHRMMDRAVRLGRIPRGRGVYVTEFGFQTNPPDRRYGLSLDRHATAINEADRLYYADPRIKSISQFELFDVPSAPDENPANEVYTAGLRFLDGTPKPSLAAYRMPLVVSLRSRDEVEVWGQVRPAAGPATADIMVSPRSEGPFRPALRVRTSRAGYFQLLLRRKDAARLHYRLRWRSSDGVLFQSRKARAGRPIRYLG